MKHQAYGFSLAPFLLRMMGAAGVKIDCMNEVSELLAIASTYPRMVTALISRMAWTAYRQLLHQICGLSPIQELKTTRQWPWHSYREYAGQKSPSQAPQSHHGLSRITTDQAQGRRSIARCDPVGGLSSNPIAGSTIFVQYHGVLTTALWWCDNHWLPQGGCKPMQEILDCRLSASRQQCRSTQGAGRG